MKAVVIGLGEFGMAAALALAENGVEVIAIDRALDLVDRIKAHVAHAVCLDARDEKALEAQGVRNADVLVAAIGADFESQILVVVHARKLGVRHVIARATTADHLRVLQAVGAHRVLNPEEEAARHMVQRTLIPDIERYLELAEGFSVVEAHTPPAAVGKTLAELELRARYRLNLIAIVEPDATSSHEHRRFNLVPEPNRSLSAEDVLVMVGSDLDLARFFEEFTAA